MTRTRFVDITDRIIYLRSIPVTAALSPPVLKIVASYLTERSFPAGTVMMREGEPIEALHLLTEGKLALVRKGKPFGELAPPQSLGFLGILARSDGTYDATAEVDTRSLELRAEALLELIEDHSDLLRSTIRYLAERDLYEVQELPVDALEQRLLGKQREVSDKTMDLVERLLFLRDLGAFKRTNLNALTVLARQLEEVRFAPGERIWSDGDPAEHQLWCLSGTARCTSGDKTWRAGGDSVLGGLEGIAARPRWYTLEAETAMVTMRGTTAGFLDVAEDDFGMAADFIAMLARDVVGLLERRAQLGQSSVGVLRNVSNLGAVPVGA